MLFGKKPKDLKLATWASIEELEQLWLQGHYAEVEAKSEGAFNEVALLAAGDGWSSLSDEVLTLSAVLCIIGRDPSGADALLATSETIEDFIKNDPRVERWSNSLITRRTWRLEAIAGKTEIPLAADFALQQLWKGAGDVTAAGEAVSRCAPGTMWDKDRNFNAMYLANLFQIQAVSVKWSDQQKVEAYQRTWNLFQWFIAWGSFTEFTAALQELEAEE